MTAQFKITRQFENKGEGAIRRVLFGQFEDPDSLTDKLSYGNSPGALEQARVLIVVAPASDAIGCDVEALYSAIRNPVKYPSGIVHDPINEGEHAVMYPELETPDVFMGRLKAWLHPEAGEDKNVQRIRQTHQLCQAITMFPKSEWPSAKKIINDASGFNLDISYGNAIINATLPLAAAIMEKYGAYDQPFEEFLRVAKEYAATANMNSPILQYQHRHSNARWVEDINKLVEVPLMQTRFGGGSQNVLHR